RTRHTVTRTGCPMAVLSFGTRVTVDVREAQGRNIGLRPRDVGAVLLPFNGKGSGQARPMRSQSPRFGDNFRLRADIDPPEVVRRGTTRTPNDFFHGFLQRFRLGPRLNLQADAQRESSRALAIQALDERRLASHR